MANIPHIVYATDDNFAEILGVSLVSLYENSKDVDDIIVYVLDSGISDENIKKLKSLPKNIAGVIFLLSRQLISVKNCQ